MARLPECVQMEKCYDFLQASEFVPLVPEVWRLALDACSGIDDVWFAAQTIMRFIYDNFDYKPDSTTVSTVMTEVLAHRRGVCQDFAHVMLGMCRSLKIPARYVSGYLYNGPDGHLLGVAGVARVVRGFSARRRLARAGPHQQSIRRRTLRQGRCRARLRGHRSRQRQLQRHAFKDHESGGPGDSP